MPKCDICGKEKKNLKAHKRMAHSGDGGGPDPTEPKSELEIAQILYEDIVVPLCRVHNIAIKPWEQVDKKDFLLVAERIKG